MADPLTPAIAVSNLVKRYAKSKTNAVDGVSFEVSRGEIFGLLGPNGAGKTTIIGVLTTFIVPTAGSTSIMGIDVARDPIDVKQRIAVVPAAEQSGPQPEGSRDSHLSRRLSRHAAQTSRSPRR